jgi:hypothetical protein
VIELSGTEGGAFDSVAEERVQEHPVYKKKFNLHKQSISLLIISFGFHPGGKNPARVSWVRCTLLKKHLVKPHF